EQEQHDVGCRAVQLGADVLGARPALDDHLAFGDRGVRAGVAGGLSGLDLLQPPPAATTGGARTGAAGAPPTTGPTAGTSRSPTRTTGEAATSWPAGEAAGGATGARGRARP